MEVGHWVIFCFCCTQNGQILTAVVPKNGTAFKSNSCIQKCGTVQPWDASVSERLMTESLQHINKIQRLLLWHLEISRTCFQFQVNQTMVFFFVFQSLFIWVKASISFWQPVSTSKTSWDLTILPFCVLVWRFLIISGHCCSLFHVPGWSLQGYHKVFVPIQESQQDRRHNKDKEPHNACFGSGFWDHISN